MTFPARGSSPSPGEYGHASARPSSSTPPAPSCCSKTNATPGGRYSKTPCWHHWPGRPPPTTLDGRWWAIELDGTRHDRAVRTWDTPPADCPALVRLAVVHHDLAGQWLEEEHPVYGMPKNPYHRVDALPSGRHIQVLVNGEPPATTHRPALIIETGVPPRW
jgi:hypothetical protein